MKISSVFACCVAGGLSLACATVSKPTTDKPQIDFSLKDLEGNTHELSTYTGQVVLLDLWATWCGPCQQALPFYAKLQAQYREHGFSVIAVSLDEDRSALDEFLLEQFGEGRLPFVVLHDAQASLAQQVSNDVMPTTLIIDRNGKTVHLHGGFNPTQDKVPLDGQIRKALDL